MKRFLIFVLLAGLLFAQAASHQYVSVETPEGSSSFYITGTGSDTSAAFDAWEFMCNEIFVYDTAGTDSSSIQYTFQMAADSSSSAWGNWTTIETWTFATDSTYSKQNITDNPVYPLRFGRYIVTGTSTNKKLYAVQVQIYHYNYRQVGRR